MSLNDWAVLCAIPGTVVMVLSAVFDIRPPMWSIWLGFVGMVAALLLVCAA